MRISSFLLILAHLMREVLVRLSIKRNLQSFGNSYRPARVPVVKKAISSQLWLLSISWDDPFQIQDYNRWIQFRDYLRNFTGITSLYWISFAFWFLRTSRILRCLCKSIARQSCQELCFFCTLVERNPFVSVIVHLASPTSMKWTKTIFQCLKSSTNNLKKYKTKNNILD